MYRNGLDTIGWHNDKEALNTPVVSISLGATRKFRFRKIKDKEGKINKVGYEKELLLKSGDCLFMKDSCQKIYKHCVPTEKTVKAPRINLTFRKFDE